jgi:hypothetical protein
MGVYVNPIGVRKEKWLADNGEIAALAPKSFNERPDQLAVCLVNNGPFTAAGVVYSDIELRAFTEPRDWRPKYWFWVDTAKLLQVSNLSDYLKV